MRIAEYARRIAPDRLAAMRDALRTSPDPSAAISRAAMGAALDETQMLELMRFLDSLARVDALLEADGVDERFINEPAKIVARALEPGRAGKYGFYLADAFEDGLASARAQSRRAQAEFDSARGRLAQNAAQALGRDEIAGTEFIVMRDDVRALPAGVRVIREAPTYFLCELELDDAALEALRKRDTAVEESAQAEEAVRARITAPVHRHAQSLNELLDSAGRFDLLLAQVRFAQAYDCVVPEIVEDAVLKFTDAAYVPLAEEVAAQGQVYEPISIDLANVAVLTGPNMGGKTAALRTCGFVAMLTAFGIPVPARAVRAGLFDEIAWLGIGADEEPGGLLSSFAREVVRLRDVLERPAARMLLLIDEFARTTTPAEGRALLIALVRALQRRARTALVATHLAGIARAAGVAHFAVRGLREVPNAVPGADLPELLAVLAKAMDYSVAPVTGPENGRGDAIALAHLLGLDDEVVAEAGIALDHEGAG